MRLAAIELRERAAVEIVAGFLVLALTASIAAKQLNGFDLTDALVPEDEIMSGGPPRDGIPALHDPKFVTAAEAGTLYGADARAVVVRAGKHVKAYPIAVLNWHEIVNDVIGDQPITVTYCPLCGTGVVFDSRVGEEVLRFGVSGLLYQSDVLMYDTKSESLWSQLRRQAVTGKHKGKKLKVRRSYVDVLANVLKEHPDATVLSTNTGFQRDY